MIFLNHAEKYRSSIINLLGSISIVENYSIWELTQPPYSTTDPQVPENNSILKNPKSLFTFTLLKRLAYNPSSSSKGHLYALYS